MTYTGNECYTEKHSGKLFYHYHIYHIFMVNTWGNNTDISSNLQTGTINMFSWLTQSQLVVRSQYCHKKIRNLYYKSANLDHLPVWPRQTVPCHRHGTMIRHGKVRVWQQCWHGGAKPKLCISLIWACILKNSLISKNRRKYCGCQQ